MKTEAYITIILNGAVSTTRLDHVDVARDHNYVCVTSFDDNVQRYIDAN
jgi:hypothetical protein